MQIRKAVITAAGRGVRLYPASDSVQKGMFPFIDRDGINKPVIQIIAEEALESGIEEICVVCVPGDEERYRDGFQLLRENLLTAYRGADWAREQDDRLSNLMRRLHFAVQQEAGGYGDAVYRAREFIGNEPFLLLLGDHLYISHTKDARCAQQLIGLAQQEKCPVSAVHATREHLVTHYGTVGGKRLPDRAGVYQIERILEKPSISQAELELQVPGLRAGHYLCFFGMHVLSPAVFFILESQINAGLRQQGQLQLTPALEQLARAEKYLALEVTGTRYDIGRRFGLLQSQLALALNGCDRDEVLTLVINLLAETGRRENRDTED
ncbi:MAG: sugar phosphate nucleotidyltransferase [bacterium]|nr:sugar phosphate nucleotidyltransferase [Candidatus Sumerlaeota bacterium]